MYVTVKYLGEDGKPRGRGYSYRTALALTVGERVIAPTGSGPRDGIVTEVDVPQSSIDPTILPLLREITERPAPPKQEDTANAGKPVRIEPDMEETAIMEHGASLMRVAQLPVIEERLRSMKVYVEAMADEAKRMACTEETVQAVKSRRAELSARFKELEEQRKAVKQAVMAPYAALEAVYKECIFTPFSAADAALKAKIDEVEGQQKAACEARLRKWFDELTLTHGVGWLTWEQTGVKVDLTSAKQKTPTKLMDRLNEICAKVALDTEAIDRMEDAAEVAAEYKVSLNLAAAVKVVQDRHAALDREREAAEARKQEQIARMQAQARVEAAAPEVLAPPTQGTGLREQDSGNEKVYKCSFTVRGTKDQLRALKNYMKQEGISYE